jgi:hypothetical protein
MFGSTNYELTNVRVNECLGQRMFGSMNVPVDECSGRQMFGLMNVQVDKFLPYYKVNVCLGRQTFSR